jgi:hypothetical protein
VTEGDGLQEAVLRKINWDLVLRPNQSKLGIPGQELLDLCFVFRWIHIAG